MEEKSGLPPVVELSQEEAHKEDHARTDDDGQIGVERRVKTVEGGSFVDERTEAHPCNGEDPRDDSRHHVGSARVVTHHSQQKESQHSSAKD